MARKMFVDLERCIGCWTCSMACKVGNGLADDEYHVTIRTNGLGAGIDRPQGVYPNLRMSWQPIYNNACDFCARNVAEGHPQYCVQDCPTEALAWGGPDDPESPFSRELERCRARHYHTFELPPYENSKAGVVYATKS